MAHKAIIKKITTPGLISKRFDSVTPTQAIVDFLARKHVILSNNNSFLTTSSTSSKNDLYSSFETWIMNKFRKLSLNKTVVAS
jgi:hypothetical protein